MADMKTQILKEAARLVRQGGLASLTYDALAARLKVSKQAVLYWFPKKPLLLAALAEPAFAAEAQAVRAAVDGAPPDARAEAVVRAIIDFHLADMDRFRLIYLAPQQGRPGPKVEMPPEVQARVHASTEQMYVAIAEALGGSAEAQAQAVALHMSALGVVLVRALTGQIGDATYAAMPDMGAILGQVWGRATRS